jgi:response regulator RpfG family c-di-GMP phosphodiesterase
MNSILPVCYFQSRKLFVDDDVNFIQSILLQKQNQQCSTINNPHQALDYLLNEYQSALPNLYKNDDNIIDDENQRLLSIDVQKIQHFVAEQQKNEIGVLFVDYQMPTMSGVDFLRQIKHLPMKKILFTGYEDYQVGIQAFNEGLIDGYLRKGDVEFMNLLNAMESDLEWKFFQTISEKLSVMDGFSYLKSPAMNNYLKGMLERREIHTFSLSNLQGDFTLIDTQNNEHTLLVRDKSELAELATLAEEDGATSAVVAQLENGEAIPYFNGQPSWQTPASEWEGNMQALKRLADNEDYYYVTINTNNRTA